jgi:hypothetical protein
MTFSCQFSPFLSCVTRSKRPGPVTILKLAPGKKRPAHPVSWGDAPADSIQAMLE